MADVSYVTCVISECVVKAVSVFQQILRAEALNLPSILEVFKYFRSI